MPKEKKDFRIVFMGTPEFAVPSLAILVKNDFNISAVVTAPDKPAGRGLHLHESAVKKYATEKNLFVLQPEKLKSPDFIESLNALQPDLMVVVAFRMLPEIIWSMPAVGTFNLHASLLPQYRGAAPINWAIMNGEKETGLTTFFLEHEIDTGAIILQEKISIGENETAGELHDRMKIEGANLVLKTVNLILNEEYKLTPQVAVQPVYSAPKIFSEQCEINWAKSYSEIQNHIRGLSPYPGAFTTLNGKMLKVFKSKKSDVENFQIQKSEPGKAESDGKTFLRFHCADFPIDLLEIQLEGKKRMNVQEFLRGNKI